MRLLGEPIGLDREALLAAEPVELRDAFELLDEDGRPFPFDRLPGRIALTGVEPQPVIARYRVQGHGRGRAGCGSRRARCAPPTAP